MRYVFVAKHRAVYPISVMCRVLEVSSAGFYSHMKRSATPLPDPDATLRECVRGVHRQSRRTYGRPRIVRALRADGHVIGPKRVQRLMREAGLRGVCKGRFTPRTTDSAHTRPIAPNVLQRRFEVDAPITAWVSDITYLPTKEGWMYLAVVIALKTHQVLGYSLADRMPVDLVQQAFANACSASPTDAGVIFHSDRGSQYASHDFTHDLTSLGFVPSMSRKGNCWERAACPRGITQWQKAFFSTLKAEEADGVYPTKADAYAGITAYIHGFYNPTRLHSALGYLSPNDYARKLKKGGQPTP